jgi:hypothetical protein
MLRDRRLNRKSFRFREAELQEDPETLNTQNVQPTLATQEEVDAATNEANEAPQESALVDEETPASETSTQEDGTEDQNPDLVAPEDASGDVLEEETPQEGNQPEETAELVAEPDQAMFTPPAEGYVPSGWVKIEDLAAAVAQVTGDAEVASTAPDTQSAIVSNKVLNTEAANPTEFPEEKNPEDQSIEESKKSKGRKLEEAEEDVPEAEEDPLEEDVSEEDEDLSEEEEDAESDEEDDLEDDVEKDDTADAIDQMLAEPTEEDVDLLRKVDSFINDIQDDAEDWKGEIKKDQDEFEDHVSRASDSLANSSEFLRGLLEDPQDEDEDLEDDEDKLGDEDFEDEEDLDEDEDFDDEDDDLDDDEDQYTESRGRHFNPLRNMKESYEGFLPAGSEHFQDEDNLVESYKRTAAARRHAIAKFRESIKRRSSNYERDNSRNFSEALRAPRNTFRENSRDSRAWSSNRFEEKFEEKQKLNYRELLENGFLG